MKRIFTTLAQKWPEYLLEILVITIGVLGAFGLNNWQQTAKDRKQERQIVASLLSEFEVNQRLLKENQNTVSLAVASGLQVLGHFSNKTTPNAEVADTLIYHVLGISAYNPSNGALLDVITGGKIGLIQNDSLRNLLLAFDGKVEDLKELERRSNDHLREGLFPYLHDWFSYGSMDARVNTYGIDWPSRGFDSDLDYIFNDRKFESLVDDHVWRCLAITQMQEDLLQNILDIQHLLREVGNE